MKRILILGAAGRDFHNFNVLFRDNSNYHVVAFTATQIPDIAGRRYPPELAGCLYPEGIPILEEKDLEKLVAEYEIDAVVFSYSDVSHQNLMHLASRTVAADADFWLLGTEHTQIKSSIPVISVCAVRTGCGKSPVSRLAAEKLRGLGSKAGSDSASHALWGSCEAGGATVRHHGRPRSAAMHHRGTGRV